MSKYYFPLHGGVHSQSLCRRIFFPYIYILKSLELLTSVFYAVRLEFSCEDTNKNPHVWHKIMRYFIVHKKALRSQIEGI